MTTFGQRCIGEEQDYPMYMQDIYGSYIDCNCNNCKRLRQDAEVLDNTRLNSIIKHNSQINSI